MAVDMNNQAHDTSNVALMVIWLKEKWLTGRGWVKDADNQWSKDGESMEAYSLDGAVKKENPDI